jgi:anti-sigma factor (TIGR02949 family)
MAFACADIDTLVHTYLDGELAAHDLEDLELHIAGCAACKARVDDELQFRAELRQKLAPPRAPDLLRARVSALLDAEDRAASTAQRKRNIAWVLPGAASVAAAAALVLVFALPDRGQTEQAQPANSNTPPGPARITAPQQVPVPDLAAFGARPKSFRQEPDRADIMYESNHNSRRVFQLSIFPDRRAVQPHGQKMDLDGIELWVMPFGGQSAITILRGSQAFVLQSDSMSIDELVEIVRGGNEGWLRHVDPHPEPE